MSFLYNLILIVSLSIVAICCSKKTKLQLACIHIILGFLASSMLDFQKDIWVLLGMFGASIVAFLAGNEFDHQYLIKNRAKLVPFSIVSFTVPFFIIYSILYYGFGWANKAALISSAALAETSIAMVYAVVTSRDYGEVGKFVFCALHLTDIMVLLFITFLVMEFDGKNIIIFFICNLIPYMTVKFLKKNPPSDQFLTKYGPYLFCFFILLTAFSTKFIKALPVLPVFMLGLYSSDLTKDTAIKQKIREFGYLFLVPLYFIRAGSLASFHALLEGGKIIFILFMTKYGSKAMPLYYLARKYGYSFKEAGFIANLMSTGLTLGIFIVLFALDNQILTREQYSLLLSVIIFTAIIPTVIAERTLAPGKYN